MKLKPKRRPVRPNPKEKPVSCPKNPVPVRVASCYDGHDCEGQDILSMAGIQARFRSTQTGCAWSETAMVAYPKTCVDFEIAPDGEYEVQIRQLRHGVPPSTIGAGAVSTIAGPWSESLIIQASMGVPVQIKPPHLEPVPGCVR